MPDRRVLVTRPQPGAGKTARLLGEMGFAPIVLPLSQTCGLTIDLAGIPAGIDAVAITSVNAVRHAPQDLIAILADRRCFAVGAKTAAAARAAGFNSVIEGPGDASGLADRLVEEAAPGASVAYLAGRVRLEAFEKRLREARIAVFAIETYDTQPVSQSNESLASAFGDQRIDAVLVYSSRAADALATIIGRPEWHFHFANTRYFCLSTRIAASLRESDRDRLSIAAEPTEDALLGLLKKAF